MPRKQSTAAQIALVVRELDNGAPVAELWRKVGVSDVTLYNWKRKYAGRGTPEIRRLRQLEEEKAKRKRLVADLTLEKGRLQEGPSTKSGSLPAAGGSCRSCRNAIALVSAGRAGRYRGDGGSIAIGVGALRRRPYGAALRSERRAERVMGAEGCLFY
jgi:putative transposase